jgi:hypothetical protein
MVNICLVAHFAYGAVTGGRQGLSVALKGDESDGMVGG